MAEAQMPSARWFRTLRDLTGLSQDKFGEMADVSGSAVSQWERDETKPELKTYLALVENLVNLAISKKDEELLTAATAFGSLLPSPPFDPSWEQPMPIPLLSKVTAGKWGDVVDPYVLGKADKMLFSERGYGPNTFALEIEGASMSARFQEGDIVLIDPSVEPMPGDFVVAKLEESEEATFKRLKRRPDRLLLEPLNDAYETLDFHLKLCFSPTQPRCCLWRPAPIPRCSGCLPPNRDEVRRRLAAERKQLGADHR